MRRTWSEIKPPFDVASILSRDSCLRSHASIISRVFWSFCMLLFLSFGITGLGVISSTSISPVDLLTPSIVLLLAFSAAFPSLFMLVLESRQAVNGYYRLHIFLFLINVRASKQHGNKNQSYYIRKISSPTRNSRYLVHQGNRWVSSIKTACAIYDPGYSSSFLTLDRGIS